MTNTLIIDITQIVIVVGAWFSTYTRLTNQITALETKMDLVMKKLGGI